MQTLHDVRAHLRVRYRAAVGSAAIMERKHMQDLMVVNDQMQFVGTITSFMFSKCFATAGTAVAGRRRNRDRRGCR